MDEASFQDLIRRVRMRDEAAAAELVRRYEPAIRTVIRAQLTDRSLRCLFDSMDICQSVLANFFVRAALGEFELNRTTHKRKWLRLLLMISGILHGEALAVGYPSQD